jgi:peptidoglycan/LPS O-acetylase OafA/YrhL
MAPFSLAVLIGALLVLALAPFGGERELVDTGIFYVIGVPTGMAAAGVCAWYWPQRAWRYGIAVALGQFLATFALNGEIGNLFPLTLMFFAVLALPMVVTAGLAGWLHRRPPV